MSTEKKNWETLIKLDPDGKYPKYIRVKETNIQIIKLACGSITHRIGDPTINNYSNNGLTPFGAVNLRRSSLRRRIRQRGINARRRMPHGGR
jgi:hypothetical protein